MRFLISLLILVLVLLASCNSISDAEEVFEEVEVPASNTEDEEDPIESGNGG